MMKSFILIILTLVLSTGLMAKTQGSFKLLTHEHYIHLTDKEKADYHVMIMELMVELESQYKTETKTYGFNKSRLEKFNKAISDIQNVFLPNAYAAPPISPAALANEWNKLASDFSSISTRTSGNDDGNCVFAGWVSRVKRNNCIHPMAAEFNTSPTSQTVEFKSYPRDPARGCNAAEMQGKTIQCNPLIFGYKKKSEGTLFCVSTENLAENSSFKCMAKALESAADNSTDSASVRLSDLASRYTANPTAFSSVMNFNFKTCICPTAPAGYSSRYQNHIRPDINNPGAAGKYQACYGLLRMMDKTLTACTTVPEVIDQNTKDILSSFKSFTESHRDFTSANAGNSAKDSYRNFLSTTLQQGSAQTAYNNLCGNTPVVVTPEDTRTPSCAIACIPVATPPAPSAGLVKSNAVMTCSVSEIKIPGPNNTMTDAASPLISGGFTLPAALPAPGASLQPIEIKFTATGVTGEKTLSCPATFTPAATAAPTCAADCTVTPAQGSTPETVTCAPKITINGSDPINGTAPSSVAKDATSINVTYRIPGSDQDQTIACPVTMTQADPGAPTCSATCVHTPARAAVPNGAAAVAETNVCTAQVTVGSNPVAGTVPATIAKGATPISVKYTLPGTANQSGNGQEQTIDCPATWSGIPVDTSSTPSLDVTTSPDGETKYKVTATATNAVGWSIKLTAKDPGTGSSNKNVTASENTSELIVDRKSAKFQVCGQLDKTGETAPAEICKDIPELGAPTTPDGQPDRKVSPINTPKLAPPQAPFMRNGADTSARGIK